MNRPNYGGNQQPHQQQSFSGYQQHAQGGRQQGSVNRNRQPQQYHQPQQQFHNNQGYQNSQYNNQQRQRQDQWNLQSTQYEPDFPDFVRQFKPFPKEGESKGPASSKLIARSHNLITDDGKLDRVVICRFNPTHVLDIAQVTAHEANCLDKETIDELLNL